MEESPIHYQRLSSQSKLILILSEHLIEIQFLTLSLVLVQILPLILSQLMMTLQLMNLIWMQL